MRFELVRIERKSQKHYRMNMATQQVDRTQPYLEFTYYVYIDGIQKYSTSSIEHALSFVNKFIYAEYDKEFNNFSQIGESTNFESDLL